MSRCVERLQQSDNTTLCPHDHDRCGSTSKSRICTWYQAATARSTLPNDQVYVCCACEVPHGTQGHSSRLVHCVVIVVYAALRAHIYRHGRSHASVRFFQVQADCCFTSVAVYSHQLSLCWHKPHTCTAQTHCRQDLEICSHWNSADTTGNDLNVLSLRVCLQLSLSFTQDQVGAVTRAMTSHHYSRLVPGSTMLQMLPSTQSNMCAI
jgi:hypothetical protein